MKRFLPWVILFFLLLVLVPVLAFNGIILPAKILGVVLVLTLSVALRVWMRNSGKLKLSPDTIKFSINERYTLNEYSPLYSAASKQLKKEIEKRLGKLVSELAFDQTDGKDPNGEECLLAGLLILFANWDSGYINSVGKIVVLCDAESEVEDSKNEPLLLFLVKSKVKEHALSVSNFSDLSLKTPELASSLGTFYRESKKN